MILVDANILLYAEDSLSPYNEPACRWWDTQLSGTGTTCLCWTVVSAFIRISTNPRVFEHPLSLRQAIARVQSWMDQPCVRVIRPTERHWVIYRQLLAEYQASANLVIDAHLAALAIEHGCTLISTDQDFARFSKLKWTNPLRSNKK